MPREEDGDFDDVNSLVERKREERTHSKSVPRDFQREENNILSRTIISQTWKAEVFDLSSFQLCPEESAGEAEGTMGGKTDGLVQPGWGSG